MNPSDQINAVALWAGLLSSIAGIVLSVGAFVFGIVANNRATAVSDQTIKSLQKIESAVEQLSDDTRTLIKAGWEKMLSGVSTASSIVEGHDDIAPVAKDGLTEEVISRLTKIEGFNNGLATLDQVQEIQKVVEQLRKSINLQAKNQSTQKTPTSDIDRLVSVLDKLNPYSRAMFEVIASNRHLTEAQYDALLDSKYGDDFQELRDAGLIVPLAGLEKDKKVPVYWLPSSYAKVHKVARQMSRVETSIRPDVAGALREIGYTVKD